MRPKNKQDKVKTARRKYLSRRLLCRGERFVLWRDEVCFPDGKKIFREWAARPSISAMVTVLPDWRFVLVNQHRYGVNKALWEVPAGTVGKRESSAACARRECEEETGYRPGKIEPLGSFAPTPAFSDERVYLYVVSRLMKTRQNCEEDERISVGIFSAARVKTMLKRGIIEDAKSIIAFTRYFGRLK
jgi:ADP-ribose pyrophosphatase